MCIMFHPAADRARLDSTPPTLAAGISQIFSRARQEAPCLVVFEDIDSLVDEHNRSFFLNEVDGLEDNDGLLMASFESTGGMRVEATSRG